MKLHILSLLVLPLLLGSCNGYLNEEPKGKKIPKTLADYEALLRDEYTNAKAGAANAMRLLGDYQVNLSSLKGESITRANYLWDEKADRATLNKADEDCYYHNYAIISTCNLILENVPTATNCTQAEREEVMAYARVKRAASYFRLVNFYADTYQPTTASSTLGVPLITSADVNAPYYQATVAEIYEFITNDLLTALPALPDKGLTILHPGAGAAHALLSRVYLQMMDYDNALAQAQEALKINDRLTDWNAIYDQYANIVEDSTSYTNIPSQDDFESVENYYFCHGNGSPNYGQNDLNLPQERGQKVEEGDAQFAVRWKLRTVNQDTYYKGMTMGYHNKAGVSTPEVYLIAAECTARKGDITTAMQLLDKVRVTRIRPDKYQPSSATNLREAIEKIRLTKDNEGLNSMFPFADAKRFNAEGTYARTLTKVYEGQTLTLSPTSHLWTMVFPAGAVKNHGNGSIIQNSH